MATARNGRADAMPPGLIACVVLCVAAAAVRADQIVIGDRDHLGVTIVAFEKGKLAFRPASGSIERSNLAEVSMIVVDSVAEAVDLNQAEKYLQTDAEQAIVRYERALRSARDFWIDLILARLQQLYNRGGPLDRLAENFIRLAERDATSALALLPDPVPAPKSDEAQRAIKLLDAAQGKPEFARRRAPLRLLTFAIMLRGGELGLDELASEVAAVALEADAPLAAYRIKLEALERLRATDHRGEILTDVDDALDSAPKAILPDLLLLKGQVLFDDARDREGYIRAGWAFMRLPIHFADDSRAADGLFGTAQVYERLGVREKAVALLRECLANPHAAPPTQERARTMLDRLNAARARPPAGRP